jgi:signal transduction histidine kinase/CheY-like chemotaxis protein
MANSVNDIPTAILILLLEDSSIDADLVRAHLLKEGFVFELDRVESREDFETALRTRPYDLILADHSLPNFNGVAALDYVREHHAGIPFIFVSATLGEELAVECLKQGATDYVLKQRLSRLGPAVTRALELARERRSRLLSEAKLRDSEERLSFALTASNIGDWRLDLASGEMECSSICKANYGQPADVPLNLPEFLNAIHPDDVNRVRQALQPTGEPHASCDVEYRVVWPDGTLRWILTRGRAICDEAGKPVGMAGISLDVTDRKLAEIERETILARELLRSEQLRKLAGAATRLNAAGDVGSVAGVITEEARHLIGAHQSATHTLTAADRSESVALSLSEKYSRWRGQISRLGGAALRAAILKSMKPARFCCQDLADQSAPPDEADLPPLLGWLGSPLLGRSGKCLGVIQLSDKGEGEFDADDESILVQLSQMGAVAIENAQLYHELREKDRKKDEFLAMLAHELRNPIASVKNAVALLKLSPDRSNRDWARDVIDRQSSHLARLIDDLLDVSRITSGKIRLKPVAVDARGIVRNAVEAVRPLVQQRNHALTVKIDDVSMPLMADPTRLEQVLVNLLTNAAKYTEPGGQVSISAARDDGEIVFRIQDDGLGISPNKLPQMFELFAQGERSIARSEGGLGVGLTIVQKLVELHHGSVSAHSDGQGKGSRFDVRLPIAETAVAETKAVELQVPSRPQAIRVLVVDDNIDTTTGMAQLLTLLGYEVETAFNGRDALEVAAQFLPDFILLDIGLPGLNGYQVASRLKSHPVCSAAVVIAVSGYGQVEDRRRSLEAGFDHHLVKPIDPDTLLKLLASPPPLRPDRDGTANQDNPAKRDGKLD